MINRMGDNQIVIGYYPKSNMDIVWDYVERSDTGNARYLSKEGVMTIPFMKLLPGQDANKFKNCFYLSSDLKKWLNRGFLEEYFKPEERIKIKSVSIPTISEIVRWYPLKENRVCLASCSAKENGAGIFCSYNKAEACVYWLADTGRKPGMSATVVLADGKIYKSAY